VVTAPRDMQQKDLRPLPELIRRQDGANDEPGKWRIDTCVAERGAPRTAVLHRHMVAPVQDYELDRVIRAHEMMHAKVSPGDRQPWIDRGIATGRALVCAEEARVNFLIEKAGFDTNFLKDGTELSAGERIAERGDWAEAVYFMACVSGTGGMNRYLTGIRRHKRAWGPRLRQIHQLVQKELQRIWREEGGDELGSTRIATDSSVDPAGELITGFFHTEAIAEYLDRLADPQNSEDEDKEPEDSDPRGGDVVGTTRPSGEPPLSKRSLDGQRPLRRSEAGSWAQLNVKHQNLTRHVPGGLGKRRIASNSGRNPRRTTRMITDPHKRIFDRKISGDGGVVLIDHSGSMDLSEKDVLEIMEAAPGCTVACYCTHKWDRNGRPNLWVLGAGGRMTTTIPRSRGGNGVDHPALVWAIEQKQRRNEPVIWVTDGGVMGPGQSYKHQLAMQCIKTVQRSDVLIRNSVKNAVELLADLARRKQVKQRWPSNFRITYWRVTGKRLAA